MKGKRKRREPRFKARVALEALKGLKTLQQIAQEYQSHPVQVSEWKKIMVEGAAEAFGPGRVRTTIGCFESWDANMIGDTGCGFCKIPGWSRRITGPIGCYDPR